MKKYLAIDLGDKRVGLAAEQIGIAMPLRIVDRVKIIPEMKKEIKARGITDLVLGMPYDLYGIDKKQLEKTVKFYEKLKKIFPELEIHKEDERFSSFGASLQLDEMGFKGNKSKNRDDLSASIILESFLKKQKN